MNKTLLVTGGAGFIGSNFIEYYLGRYSTHKVINLDKLTYAGELSNLKSIENHPNYTFVKGDICDKPLVENLFKKHNFSGVINFAAESHVDKSIKSPDEFIQTNVFGTFNLLNSAKKHWMEAPFVYRNNCTENRFLHISTDEVYGSLADDESPFSEETPYAPNSPYSASKASSDFLVRSFFHTYGMNVITTNCSNNYGPKQHSEKLIPTIIRNAISGKPIPIYGDGKNIRDWLYVEDHCQGLELVYRKGKIGEAYNLGGNNELRNIEIALKICTILDQKLPKNYSYKDQIQYIEDRPGHDYRYAVDATKIKKELNWEPSKNFDILLSKTIDWYLENINILKSEL